MEVKEIIDSLFSLIEYKNKNYGYAVERPLRIFSKFNDKIKVGTRLDDKLSRIKNSDKLRKNDVADVMGYLVLAMHISTEKSIGEVYDCIVRLTKDLDEEDYIKYAPIGGVPDFIFKESESKFALYINRVLENIQRPKILEEFEELEETNIILLIELLTLICKEHGWTNFDEFKD